MKGVTFRIDDTLKMRQLREAEGSNSAAIDLMAKYAIHDDEVRKTMEYAEFVAIVDDMDVIEFYTLYAEFIGAAVPNQRGRRS